MFLVQFLFSLFIFYFLFIFWILFVQKKVKKNLKKRKKIFSKMLLRNNSNLLFVQIDSNVLIVALATSHPSTTNKFEDRNVLRRFSLYLNITSSKLN